MNVNTRTKHTTRGDKNVVADGGLNGISKAAVSSRTLACKARKTLQHQTAMWPTLWNVYMKIIHI